MLALSLSENVFLFHPEHRVCTLNFGLLGGYLINDEDAVYIRLYGEWVHVTVQSAIGQLVVSVSIVSTMHASARANTRQSGSRNVCTKCISVRSGFYPMQWTQRTRESTQQTQRRKRRNGHNAKTEAASILALRLLNALDENHAWQALLWSILRSRFKAIQIWVSRNQ